MENLLPRLDKKREEKTPSLTPPHPGKFDGSTLTPEELAIAQKAKAETEERRRVMDSSGDEEWGSVGKSREGGDFRWLT